MIKSQNIEIVLIRGNHKGFENKLDACAYEAMHSKESKEYHSNLINE